MHLKELIQRFVFAIIFLVIAVIAIAFARGYRPDFKEKSFVSTGIVTVTSNPKSAQVYINGALKGVTDLNLHLIPGKYKIEVKKDGYQTWEKEITLKGELVVSLYPLLFPINPSLSPQTNIGVKKAVPIDQSGKVLLFVENGNEEKDGFYLFDSARRGLSFFPPLKLILKKNQLTGWLGADFNLSDAEIFFSPDYKQMIARWPDFAALINVDEENQSPFDVTASYQTLISAWEKEKTEQQIKILETYGKEMVKIASDSFAMISFSPDENKILYQAKKSTILPSFLKNPLPSTNQTPETRELKPNRLYVYDKKEDRNYELKLSEKELKIDESLFWYPDSGHLVAVKEKKIVIVDYDGTNEQTVYSGPFEQNFVTVTPEGKLIILANLNPEANQLGDLYLVGIK
jgi:hypothetical protein